MAKGPRPPSPFEAARKIERTYAADLRKIAVELQRIADRYPLLENDPAAHLPGMEAAMRRYAATLKPWAEAKAQATVERLNAMNKRSWAQHAQNMSKALKSELERAPIADVMARYQAEQAAFIGDIAEDAADRIATLHEDVLLRGKRVDELARDLAATGKVSAARATLIARTEVARTANGLVRARAEYIGSESYTWRTARDGDVRGSHRQMEGHTVRYNDPPILDGKAAHAGEIYNCRCWQEPDIPDRYF